MTPKTYKELAEILHQRGMIHIGTKGGNPHASPIHRWVNPMTGGHVNIPDRGPKPLSPMKMAEVLERLGFSGPPDLEA